MVFRYHVFVLGKLQCSFVFQNKKEMDVWLKTKFKDLENKYGKLQTRINKLDKLKIGDTCKVIGDGNEVYKIVDLVKYEENRYGFVLDSGCVEEVNKCHID